MKIAIVGAGMAGLACAETLRAAGHITCLFDKGRRAGGRMSTRGVETALGAVDFDYGAQYFTARDPAFQARVAAWRRDGCIAPWPAAGSDAFVGAPGMSAPVEQMARGLDVRWNTRVEALERVPFRNHLTDKKSLLLQRGEALSESQESATFVENALLAGPGGWRLQGPGISDDAFDAVVVAIPAEQAAALLRPVEPRMAEQAAATRSEPCWTVMAVFAERLRIETDVVRDQGTVRWAARNGSKPGRSGRESWVIQAGPDWSRSHIEDDPEDVTRDLLAAFAALVAVPTPEPIASEAHRWRYARSSAAAEGQSWNADRGLGLCGDWLLGPRIECAWLSGVMLADQIDATKARPGR